MRILVVIGHPDPHPARFCRALAEAYADGARLAGHEVELVDLAALAFPVLRNRDEWQAPPSADILAAQAKLLSCTHMAVFFPLWLGEAPALLKAFFEQLLRPGFALGTVGKGQGWAKLLGGRSARVVVTMGMPALVYRWYFRAHSVKSLERNILGFVGIGPIHETLVGSVDGLGEAGVARWRVKLRALGRRGA